MRRGPGCPSELTLHQLLTGERGEHADAAALAAHVRGCARCGAQVRDVESLAVPAPDPAFWAALVRPAARRRWTLVPLFAAAAALGAFALAPRFGAPPPASDVRTKGSAALGVIVRRASGATERLSQGGRVAPGDTLRFELAQAEAAFVVVLGLDALPSVTVYAPQAGAEPRATPAGETLLPEAIVADATPGLERIVALSCPSAPALDEVRAAATRALVAAGGPENVRDLGLPCKQSSVSFTKALPP